MNTHRSKYIKILIFGCLISFSAVILLASEKLTSRRSFSTLFEQFSFRLAIDENEVRKKGYATFKKGENLFEESKFNEALDAFQSALSIYESIAEKGGEGDTLMKLGATYEVLGRYEDSLKSYQQATEIFKKLQEKENYVGALSGAGIIFLRTGQYAKSIENFQLAISILPEASVPLNGLGLAYAYLRQYDQALIFYNRALDRLKKHNLRKGLSATLQNIGTIHELLGEADKALFFYQESLSISQEVNYLTGQDRSLSAIGELRVKLQNYDEAMAAFEQALEISEKIGDLRGVAIALNGIGTVFENTDQPIKALEFYEKALVFRRQNGDLEGQALTLSYIGKLMKSQDQDEIAIILLKQSVNLYEFIRMGLVELPQELRASYTESVADTYRFLADLLLDQGRVLEAQQVLELLKNEELRDYTKNTRNGPSTNGTPLTPPEKAVVPVYDQLISLGIKLTQCERQIPRCPEREQLQAQREQALKQFQEKATALRNLLRDRDREDPAQLRQQELTRAAQKLVKAYPKAVLIYPLVLEDKLWLVWGAQAGQQGVIFASKEIPVTRKQLSTTVIQLRTLLEQRGDEATLKQTSKQLYDWLIAPLRPELDANGIERLIFSLDRATRYIPMAVLFDGQQYLIETFTPSTILTADGTDTTDRLAPNVADNPVLGLGLSQAMSGFDALPNVETEINGIVRRDSPEDQIGLFPGDVKFNQAFTQAAFNDLIDYRILHIATHGKFVTGNPEDSFLLLGNGEPLKIPVIQTMTDLGGIHLAVLSACETAKGGIDKEGIEVSGLSYYFLTSGVKSVVASLWLVNDASTSVLMQRFYRQLAAGKSKAEALRQAQLSLKNRQAPASEGERAALAIVATRDRGPLNFSHPYYWAPFILIGNGL
jgi:CHAT domain-containing protein/Flp pilus assembly protein TadD